MCILLYTYYISEGYASAAGPPFQIRVWDSIFQTFVDHFGTLDHHLAHPGSPRGGQEVTWGRRYGFSMIPNGFWGAWWDPISRDLRECCLF